jgi:hypothetical protein
MLRNFGMVIDSVIEENKADDFVVQTHNKQLITNLKKWFEYLYPLYNQIEQFQDVSECIQAAKNTNDPIEKAFYTLGIYVLNFQIMLYHPPLQLRIEKLERALKELEAQEAQSV